MLEARQPADWESFAGDFLPDATLYPSARPVKPQAVPAFVERLRGLSQGALQTFHETVLGTEVRVFGTVAVAIAACENVENGKDVNQVVEMLLLVKQDGAWRVAAQGWDKVVTADDPLPPWLAR